MPTTEQLRAAAVANNAANRAAGAVVLRYWPKLHTPPKHCRGTSEGSCTSGATMGLDGFCTVCHKRTVTLARLGYTIYPKEALWASYATYRAKTPQSAPKPHRKPSAVRHVPAEAPMVAHTPMPTIFAEGVKVEFPPPVAKATVVAPPGEPAPMFGPKWSVPAAFSEAVRSPEFDAAVKAAVERKHIAQASRVVVGDDGPVSMEEALEKAEATTPKFGKWQALADDGMRILEAPAEPMEPDYHRLVTDAHDALDMAGDTTDGDPAERIRAVTTHYRDTIVGLQTANAALLATLRDPDHLRAALARIEKAERIATLTRQRAELDARIAELENE